LHNPLQLQLTVFKQAMERLARAATLTTSRYQRVPAATSRNKWRHRIL